MIGYVGSPRSFRGLDFRRVADAGRRADLRRTGGGYAGGRRRVRVLTPGLRPAVGFLYGWTQLLVAKSGSIAGFAAALIICVADFCPTLNRVLYTIRLPIGPQGGPLEIHYGQLLAMTIILTLAVVNYLGVKFGGRLQVAATAVKLGLIGAIIAIGLGSGQGTLANYSSSIPVAGA